MTTVFDKSLIEFTLIKDGHLIEVYKIGGGTNDKRYSGDWGYRVLHQGDTLTAGEDLCTSTLKTHHEVAAIALEFCSATHDGTSV